MYQLLHFTNSAGTFYFMADEFARESEHIVLETPHSETRFYAERRTSVGNYADCGTFTGI